MAAVRVFAFLLLVTFAIQLVATGVVRPSEAPAQRANAAADDLAELLLGGASRRNQTAGRNDTAPSGGNILHFVESLTNKMTALAETTRCHNSTENCDVLEEMGDLLAQALRASWLRYHPYNASTRDQVARQWAAERENLRRLQLRLNATLARNAEFPQTIVSLDTR